MSFDKLALIVLAQCLETFGSGLEGVVARGSWCLVRWFGALALAPVFEGQLFSFPVSKLWIWTPFAAWAIELRTFDVQVVGSHGIGGGGGRLVRLQAEGAERRLASAD